MHRQAAGRGSALAILLPVAAFALTLLFFTPATIRIGNYLEFGGRFPQGMPPFLAASAVLTLVLFLALLPTLRCPGALRIAVATVTALAFLAWLQGNVLVWDYGILDGRAIEWKALVNRGIVDALVWGIVVGASVTAASFVPARHVVRISKIASVCLVAVQLLSVAWSWRAMPKDQVVQRRDRDDDTLFLFSDRLNVIVLVLDTFQSDFFQDIVRDDAGLRARFDGFTYFRNAVADSNGTIAAVPAMLTARSYDNTVPYLEYVRTSFLENSLPKTLREYGFRVDLSPMLGYTVWEDLSGLPFATRSREDPAALLREQALLADLALFRCSPHVVKREIYNDQHWFVSGMLERYQQARRGRAATPGGAPASSASAALTYADDLGNLSEFSDWNRDPRLVTAMVGSAGVASDMDAFKFIHLKGIHLPLIMNEHLAFEEMKPSRANILRQGTGVLKMAATFLERLEQLGVYDESLVFIVADHGSGVGDAKINVTERAASLNREGPYRGQFAGLKAAGIPLVLAKRVNSRGELRVSDAPVSLSDIPRTVAEELGLEAPFRGASMFDVAEGEVRERIYRAFVGPQEDVEYLAPLREYAVTGHSWDDASWRETGNIYYAPE